MNARTLGLAFTVLVLAAATTPVQAATFYVDRNNSNCSDVGPGSQAIPYCTISAALAANPGPGHTFLVRPGVYREQVTIPGSGTSANPVILRADPPGTNQVVIDGSDDFGDPLKWSFVGNGVWLAASVNWQPVQVFANGSRLTPSTLPPNQTPSGGWVYSPGNGLYVNVGGGNPGLNNTLVGRRTNGFLASGRSWVTIEGFQIVRPESRGVQLRNAASNCTVLNNTITLSGRFGIQADSCTSVRIAGNRISDGLDHGISVVSRTQNSIIEDNESFGHARPDVRAANGIYLFNSPNNVVRRNRLHDNQDTGLHIQSGSDNTVSMLNVSWNNGDHGFDNLHAANVDHVCDVAYGNLKDGFSFEGNSPNGSMFNCISVDNGLTMGRYNLYVDAGGTPGFASNDNVIWNSNGQAPVSFNGAAYGSVASFSAATAHDTRTVQANPKFVSATTGDFRLQAGSPAIDNANSGVANWPSQDATGQARMDDPGTPNTGLGPVAFGDRGAHEYMPGAVSVERLVGPRLQAAWSPNPMRVEGRIRFTLSQPGAVQVQLFDTRGALVRTVLNEPELAAGEHEARFETSRDGARLAPGVYFWRLEAAEGTASGPLVILR